MYSLTVLFQEHNLIFLKASINVKSIWVLYFCVTKMEEKGKLLTNATCSSVLLIKPNDQRIHYLFSSLDFFENLW